MPAEVPPEGGLACRNGSVGGNLFHAGVAGIDRLVASGAAMLLLLLFLLFAILAPLSLFCMSGLCTPCS